MEERVKATEQEARRKALDEFMQDFRVEERHYFRENKSVAARQKSMVLQERLYFRNIPLSNWVEHEMVVEDDMRGRPAHRQGPFHLQHQESAREKAKPRFRACSRKRPRPALLRSSPPPCTATLN